MEITKTQYETESEEFKSLSDSDKSAFTPSEDGKTQTLDWSKLKTEKDVDDVRRAHSRSQGERNEALGKVSDLEKKVARYEALGKYDELSALVDANHKGTKSDKDTPPSEVKIEDLPLSVQREIKEAREAKEKLEVDLKTKTEFVNNGIIKDEVGKTITELGLNPAATDDIYRFARENVKVEEGTNAVLTIENNPSGFEVGKTIKEIVASQVEKSTHWKGVNKGGGFEGGNSKVSTGDNPWAKGNESKEKQFAYIDKFGVDAADAKAKEAGLHDRYDRHAA